MGDQILDDSSNFLSEEDIALIETYSTQMHDTVNRYLYKGHDDGIDGQSAQQVTDIIGAMDELFERSVAPFPYTVYTSLSARYAPDKIEVGGQYLFRGYVSTSLDYNVILDASDDGTDAPKVIYQIDISQGQRSLYSGSEYHETLLPRGSVLQVVSGPNVINPEVFGNVMLFQCVIIEEQ
jgi:hypothetical protein